MGGVHLCVRTPVHAADSTVSWCVDVHVLLELWVRCVRISLREARALPLDVCDVAMGVPRGVKLYLSSYHVHLSRLLYRLLHQL